MDPAKSGQAMTGQLGRNWLPHFLGRSTVIAGSAQPYASTKIDRDMRRTKNTYKRLRFLSIKFNMYIGSSLFRRDFGDNVKSTADSFKSWDTCMDNKTCKIVAIVGIVLAGLVVLWAISTIIQCLCMGVSCLEALCCCCCRSSKPVVYQEKQTPYNNPNMYQPVSAPMRYQPQPAYQGRGYDDENPFNDKQHARY